MWFLVAVGVAAFLALSAWPFRAERRRPEISTDDRFRADGEFAHLSQGITRYKWYGPARGPYAIVVHGLTTPMEGMEATAEALGALGYRVLTYDLYGRGLSDAPKGKQTRAFFLQQLADLCEVHDLREDLTIVGYSMGAQIATAFAVVNPYVVKQVVLIAPAGIVTGESRFSRFCRRVPLLGDWMHAMFGVRRHAKTIPNKGPNRKIDTVLRAQRKQLDRRGYMPAILSSRRGILAETFEDEHRTLARKGIPVLAIWGRLDGVIPLRASATLCEWNRGARHEMIDDADHGLPYTHGEELQEALSAVIHN